MDVTLINGQPGSDISVHDRGFQYGDGLFETLAVIKGTPLLWERHMQRLFRGAERLHIVPPAEALLQHEAETICTDVDRAVLKIILTRGISARGYAPPQNIAPTRVVNLMPWPDYPPRHRTHGVAIQFCNTKISRHAGLAGLKHLNRLEQILARSELKLDYSEGLMLDEQDHVIEGTMSNIFVIANGKLSTPDLSHSGVAGIMRDIVRERAMALALDYQVKTLTRDDILNADEIFLSNSLIGIWPVRRIEAKEYPLGELTVRMQEAIRDAHGAG